VWGGVLYLCTTLQIEYFYKIGWQLSGGVSLS
jgi:hypothetical protein